jgi:beta-glucanase (GH16 family)
MGLFRDGHSRSLVFALVCALGCGGAESGGSGTGGAPGNGGATGTGGATATGGSPGSGGASATGGAPGTGGTSGTGGATGTGGAHATGGSTGTGGASATGGAAGKGAGGASSGGHGGSAGGGGGHGGTATGAGGAAGSSGGAGGDPLAGWTLTWSDEFNGADGSAVDASKWGHDVGGGGWGNSEFEYYTNATQNAVVQGGNLVITATTAGASSYNCSYPSSGPCKYTSARLLSKGKFSQKYGRLEARIQIPEGQGIWPAFWMLGANIDSVNWPSCGEIDIMENIGKEPSINHGSLHMPASGTTTDSSLSGMYTLPGGAKLGDAFHTYAIEWSASAIKFYLDDMLYETQTPQTATGRTWAFDQPFFFILNVAVGGTWPGAPDSTTTFPQTMKVDWVRAYQPAK